MARGRIDRGFDLSRRDFLVTTGGALVGMAAFGLAIRRPPASGIPNEAASCNMARALMSLASTRIEIIRTISCMPPPRCITA